jgi:hypothetical protein
MLHVYTRDFKLYMHVAEQDHAYVFKHLIRCILLIAWLLEIRITGCWR